MEMEIPRSSYKINFCSSSLSLFNKGFDALTVEYENEKDLLMDAVSMDGHSYTSEKPILPDDNEDTQMVDESVVVMPLPQKPAYRRIIDASQKPYPKQTLDVVGQEVLVKKEEPTSLKPTEDSLQIDDGFLEDLNRKSITSAEASLTAEYVCFHCDEPFPTFLTYIGHRESHRRTKGFTTINRTCPLCNQYVEGYVQHLTEQHKQYRPNKCQKCKFSTLNQYQLVQHMVKHLTQKTLQCRACNEMYSE
jgi:hypothetical protein